MSALFEKGQLVEKNDKRFLRVLKEGGLNGNSEIWVDTWTGVEYLWHCSGYAGGLTPLLDAEGKPVVYRESTHAPEF